MEFLLHTFRLGRYIILLQLRNTFWYAGAGIKGIMPDELPPSPSPVLAERLDSPRLLCCKRNRQGMTHSLSTWKNERFSCENAIIFIRQRRIRPLTYVVGRSLVVRHSD